MISSFNTLSPAGQARRLRALAYNALAQYDLNITSLTLAGRNTNTVYRAVTADGRVYMLRVCKPGWRSPTDLAAEAVWLRALAQDPAIGAPLPVPTRAGADLATASAPGVPEPRCCVVQSWLPGRLLEHALTPANLHKMGVLFARLHAFSAEFTPPPGFSQRRLSGLFSRGEPDELFSPACADAFTPASRDLFTAVRARVDALYQDLLAAPRGPIVIHNDLWHGNIKIHRGRLHPFDFEDTVWGHPVQDLAPALQDLMLDIPPEAFEPLQAALRAGYETLAPWPETAPAQIDTLRAGRMLWVANYVAHFERPYLAGYLERSAPLLAHFLATGQLRKPAGA